MPRRPPGVEADLADPRPQRLEVGHLLFRRVLLSEERDRFVPFGVSHHVAVAVLFFIFHEALVHGVPAGLLLDQLLGEGFGVALMRSPTLVLCCFALAR